MKQDDFEIEEYRSLRTSIDMHMKLIHEIFSIMIVATSALLGVGFNYQLFVIFLLPVLIILSLSFLIVSQMNEVMFKGAYIKKRYEEHIFGWESTFLKLRQAREVGKKRLYAKAAEDALAFVLIIDVLFFICFAGFSLFFIIYVSQLTFGEYLDYVFIGSLVIVWIVAAWVAYVLNRDVLEAYTFEKEQKILKDLDTVFTSTKEPTPPRQD